MSRLLPQEKEKFIAAASLVLAKQEKMELLGEQMKKRLGGATGLVPISESQAAEFTAPSNHLIATIIEIKKAHPEVQAIRFRGRIFTVMDGGGKVGIAILKEEDIETIDA